MTNASSTAGMPVTAGVTPAVVAGNANDFYAFYLDMNGHPGLTTWMNNAWSKGPAASATQPPGGAPLQACVGQNAVYFVYSTLGGLQAFFGSGRSMGNSAPEYAPHSTVNSFCAFADGGLSLVVNAKPSTGANTLTLATLGGTTWTDHPLDKANTGLQVPSPLDSTPIASILFGTERHILYEGLRADGQTTVYDLVNPLQKDDNYKSSRMTQLSSGALGLSYFTFNNLLFALVTSKDGHMSVYYYNTQGGGDPQWVFAVLLTGAPPSGTGAQLARTAPAVVCVNGGVFAVYTDNSNNIQCVYFVPSAWQWQWMQLTGAGAAVQPNAPIPLSSLAATQFLGNTMHVCYGAAAGPGVGQIVDLYFQYPQWSTQTLYPTLPGAK